MKTGSVELPHSQALDWHNYPAAKLSLTLAPSDPFGAPDSSPEYPSQHLPHAEAELPDLAALYLLAAGW